MIWGGWYGIPLPSAKIAVDIFMVVSGFLMAYQYRAREAYEPPESARTAMRFWLRRYFRIAPVYYLFLVYITLFWSSYRNGFVILQQSNPQQWADLPVYEAAQYQMGWQNLIAHLTFVFGLIPRWSFSNLSPDWSIGLEMQFYAVFPVLYIVLSSRYWFLIAAGALGIQMVVSKWVSIMPGVVEGAEGLFPEPSFLPMKISIFVAGILCGEVYSRLRCTSAPVQYGRMGSFTILALVIGSAHSKLVLLVIAFFLFNSFQVWDKTSDIHGSVADFLNKILGNRLMKSMAEYSYAVYLCHGVFISLSGNWLFQSEWFMDLIPPVRVGLLLCGVAAASYASAAVIHWCVEKPGIEIGRRLTDRLFPLDVKDERYGATAGGS